MKQILSMLLVLCMLLGMGVNAWADGEEHITVYFRNEYMKLVNGIPSILQYYFYLGTDHLAAKDIVVQILDENETPIEEKEYPMTAVKGTGYEYWKADIPAEYVDEPMRFYCKSSGIDGDSTSSTKVPNDSGMVWNEDNAEVSNWVPYTPTQNNNITLYFRNKTKDSESGEVVDYFGTAENPAEAITIMIYDTDDTNKIIDLIAMEEFNGEYWKADVPAKWQGHKMKFYGGLLNDETVYITVPEEGNLAWNAEKYDEAAGGLWGELDSSEELLAIANACWEPYSLTTDTPPVTDDSTTDDSWYEEDDDSESLVVRIKFKGVDEADFEEIKVNLLKNGKKYDSEALSASKVSKKDWRFEWDNLDEDDDWSVALAEEPEGYDAEVVNLRGNYWTITLTPAEVEAPVVDKTNPETGAGDFVGAAVALAVVSVLGGAVLSMKK